MKKIISASLIFFLGYFAIQYVQQIKIDEEIEQAVNLKKGKKKVKIAGMGIGAENDPQNLRNWYSSRLLAPDGKIPHNIRASELEFVKSLPKNSGLIENWVARGPYNVGGRTRAMAIDVMDENVIMAGGVSGGMWRTENLGQTWTKLTDHDMLHNVTCVSQDTRDGQTNTWYYGTGEAYGNSASGNGGDAYFFGNGIYKSIDDGQTWESLESTASNTPDDFDAWDLVWDIEINASVDSIDQVFAAIYGGIYRSDDGGDSWVKVLGGSGYAYFAELEIAEGVIYASLSSDAGPDKGVWRSEDGINWMKIIPDEWPNAYDRIKMAVNPHNKNEMYVLAVTPDFGQPSTTFLYETEWNSLWRYTYIDEDTTSQHGIWENISEYIPANDPESNFNNFYAQGSYNMMIEVSPTDSNTVFIGGTNLYVSTDGFSSHENVKQIGGYQIGTVFPDFQIYQNHHPDQHEVAFIPSAPNKLVNANDGGIFITDNYLDSIVEWTPLNNGYYTTQLYTVTINEENVSNSILGGFQDNGNFYTNSTNPSDSWVMPLNGDGSFAYFNADEDVSYMSIQKGKVFKLTIDDMGNRTAHRRIDPIGAEDYLFIHPFEVDPNDENIMYLPSGGDLWRNSNLSAIELTNEWDSISEGWMNLLSLEIDEDEYVSSISVSKENPPHRLYVGTSKRDLFRIDNANSTSPIITDITNSHVPGQPFSTGDYFHNNAYVNNIAIHPNDADVALVVFSNYGVYSMYYTTNGGEDWQRAAGNLEEFNTGFGSGPSCRWASIMPFGEDTLFFVATSTGLYATNTINGNDTEWMQMGANSVGNVVCEQVKTRSMDSLLVLATHGNGVFTTKIESVDDVIHVSEFESVNDLLIYPNPASDFISIKGNKSQNWQICNLQGKVLMENKWVGNENEINVEALPSGIYLLKVGSQVKKWIKK